jgi:hypothetical protein
MRAHNLLSPRRSRQGATNPHQGESVTRAPTEMWGTDVVRILTVDDGWDQPGAVADLPIDVDIVPTDRKEIARRGDVAGTVLR